MHKVNIVLDDNHLTVYESTHKESYALHPHEHEVYQILYGIDGSGEIMLHNKWIEFSKDHAAVILPNTLHAVQSDSRLTLWVIAFSLQDQLIGLPESFFQHYYSQSFVVRMEKSKSSEIQHMFRKLLFLQSQTMMLERIAARVQLCEVLLHLAKAREYKTDTKFPAKISRMIEYIEGHYYEIESATDMANKHHMSVRYMDNLFKEYMKKTPTQYLTEVRINRARTLLEETEHEIISICFEVGFENVSTFYRSFKQFTGKTPHQYRTQS